MEGSQLKAWREKMELTQEGLAELLGSTRNTVARWERDEVGIPPYLPLALKTIEREKPKSKK